MKKDPLFFNKLAGAILTGLLIMLFSGFLAGFLAGLLLDGKGKGKGKGHDSEKESKAYNVLIEEIPQAQQIVVEEVEIESIEVRLLSANADAGRKTINKCTACHSLNKGGVNRIGPNLWNIVGKEKAKSEGYKYSEALTSHGGVWDYQSLDAFLTRPKKWLPGTKMNFVGLKKPSQRANVILWLNQNSDNPLP